MSGFPPTLVPVALAAALALLTTAAAQEASAPGRFNITPSDGGFVRLDTETGTVSRCVKRDGVWLCEPAVERKTTDEQMSDLTKAVDALSTRLDSLQGAVDALAAQLQTLTRDLESAARQSSAVESEAEPSQSPDLVMGEEREGPDLASRLIDPLISMVSNFKRDRAAGPARE